MTTSTGEYLDDGSSVSSEDLKEGFVEYAESEYSVAGPSTTSVDDKLKKYSLKIKNGGISGKDRKIEKAVEDAIGKHDLAFQQVLFRDSTILNKRFLFEGHPGCSLLHIAAFHGDIPAAKQLITSRVDINLKSQDNFAPLHFAIGCGHIETVEFLINNGAEVMATAGALRYTPLHVAVQRSRFPIARLLLTRGAVIDAPDQEGETCLHFAARYTGPDMMKLLLGEDANFRIGNRMGRTALHLACAAGDLNVVKLLLEKGADLNARDVSGYTPMDASINRCQWKVVKHLEKLHASSKLVDEDKTGKGIMHILKTRGYDETNN